MYDLEDEHYPEDFIEDWDDPMFTLPPDFLTSFSIDQLPVYEKAVKTWTHAEDFEVTESDSEGRTGCGQGSLFFYGERQDLSAFWQHFDNVRKEMHRVKPASKEAPPSPATGYL